MNLRSGSIAALLAVLIVGGCAPAATGAGGSSGPLTSATGRVYEPGIRPTQTRFAQAATIALLRGDFETALTQARQGIQADSTNAQHFFLAGEAYAALEQYAAADSMWRIAERIYPAYELEIEPSREQAWLTAFNKGVEAYNAGRIADAITQWRHAHFIYTLRPIAAQNLGLLLTQEAQYEDAIRVYREGLEALEVLPASRVLEEEEIEERTTARREMREQLVLLLMHTGGNAEAERVLRQQLQEDPNDLEVLANLATVLTNLDRAPEATELYARVLSAQDATSDQLFNIGVALFNAGQHARAAQAFARVSQAQPNNRDAWANQANAIYETSAWADLAPAAARWAELDPLNRNAALFVARAYEEQGQSARAREAVNRITSAPIHVDELQMELRQNGVAVRGRAHGNTAAPGTPIQLRFTFYGPTGQLGTQMVTVPAPASGASANFEVPFNQVASYYRYEHVQ